MHESKIHKKVVWIFFLRLFMQFKVRIDLNKFPQKPLRRICAIKAYIQAFKYEFLNLWCDFLIAVYERWLVGNKKRSQHKNRTK